MEWVQHNHKGPRGGSDVIAGLERKGNTLEIGKGKESLSHSPCLQGRSSATA